MRMIFTAGFLGAVLAAQTASAQVVSATAQKLDAGAAACEAGLAGSELRAAPIARDAGFTFEPGRQLWSWTGDGGIVAIQFNDEGCDVLVIGQVSKADVLTEHVASTARARGYRVVTNAKATPSMSRVEGTSNTLDMAFREVGGGILRLEFRRQF
jgi:hypothetical protein